MNQGRTMDRRRRVPRVPVGWSGKYRIEGKPESEWGDCTVIDISVAGVGLELFGAVPEDITGHRLALEVDATLGETVSLRLTGEVKYTREGPEDGVRAGMTFVDLSETERRILRVLELMRVGW